MKLTSLSITTKRLKEDFPCPGYYTQYVKMMADYDDPSKAGTVGVIPFRVFRRLQGPTTNKKIVKMPIYDHASQEMSEEELELIFDLEPVLKENFETGIWAGNELFDEEAFELTEE